VLYKNMHFLVLQLPFSCRSSSQDNFFIFFTQKNNDAYSIMNGQAITIYIKIVFQYKHP